MKCFLVLLALTCTALADSIEFRLITLKPEKPNQKSIKDLDQTERLEFVHKLRSLLGKNLIGAETSILIPIENKRFTYDDTKSHTYPATVDSKGNVVRTLERKIGTTISGTANQSEDGVTVSFSIQQVEILYQVSSRKPYNIHPTGHTLRTQKSLTLKAEQNSPTDHLLKEWAIIGVSTGNSQNGDLYLAIKYHQ